MTVRELIDLLKQHDPEADVYVAQTLQEGVTAMTAIEGLAPATSDYYGRAVLLELED